MITELPVDIRAAAPIIGCRKPRPRWVLFRQRGDEVVEACCCDTDEEAQVVRRQYDERPGTVQGWKVQQGKELVN